MCRGLENREIQHVFRHSRDLFIFIAVCTGIVMYLVLECGDPPRCILSKHAACDHIVCVELYGILNKTRNVTTQSTEIMTKCQCDYSLRRVLFLLVLRCKSMLKKWRSTATRELTSSSWAFSETIDSSIACLTWFATMAN